MLTAIGATELAPGLWRWSAYHPEWQEEVGCAAWATASELVLIDPQAPVEPAARERFLAQLDTARAGRPLHVLITVHFHARSAAAIAARLPGAHVWASHGDAERVGTPVGERFSPGDHLPGAIAAYGSARGGEVVLWIDEVGALVTGDVLLGGEDAQLRLCPPSWLPEGVGLPELARSLAPLRELPVELILVAHGEPVLHDARAALAAALDGV